MFRYFDMENFDKKLNWGKYAAYSLADVLKMDEGYIRWMIREMEVEFSDLLSKFIILILNTPSPTLKKAFWDNVYVVFYQNEVERKAKEREEARIRAEKEREEARIRAEKEREENERKQRQKEAELKRKAEEAKRLDLYIHDIKQMYVKTKNRKIEWIKHTSVSNSAYRRNRFVHSFEDKKIFINQEAYKGKDYKWKYKYSLVCNEYEILDARLSEIWKAIIAFEKEKNEILKAEKKKQQETILPKRRKEIEFIDIVVRVHNMHCEENHHLEDVVAVFMVTQKYGTYMEIEAPAAYCSECNCYFILNETFKEVRRKGSLLCQIMTETVYKKRKKGIYTDFGYDLADESPLRIAGYTVDAKTDLSKMERRLILEYIIDSGILTKHRVLSYLDYFIEFRKNMEFMENAVEKWRDDRAYIETYNIGEKAHVKVGRVLGKIYV